MPSMHAIPRPARGQWAAAEAQGSLCPNAPRRWRLSATTTSKPHRAHGATSGHRPCVRVYPADQPSPRTPTPSARPHVLSCQRAQHAQHTQHALRRLPPWGTVCRAGGPASAAVGESATTASPHDEAAEVAAPQVLSGRTVAVVGGGPGGMLCAAHLARLGAAVEVFESRDPADPSQPAPAVWSIGLGSSAKRAIEAAGLSSDFGPQWRFDGGAAHTVGRPTNFIGEWAGRPSPVVRHALSTQRGIVAHLQAECGRVYGDAVMVHYGMRAVGGDVCAGEVVLQDAAGEREMRTFDLVVGADGAGSAVRKLMQEQDKSLEVVVESSKLGVICNLMDPVSHPSALADLPTPSGTPFRAVPEGFDGPLTGCAVHFFPPGPDKVPGMGQASASIRHGGSEIAFSVTGEAGWMREERTEEEWVASLEASLPQLPRAWLRRTAQAVRDREQAGGLRVRSPVFVTCSKLASGRAVLLGDAAHAVSPNIGMGCNAALQDSEVLSRACIAAAGDVEATAQQYGEDRLSNAHALTLVSRRMDELATFRLKYHRDALAALAGLPYFLAQAAAFLPPSAPVPGFLKPGFNVENIFQEGRDWREVHRRVRRYGVRLAAILATVVAAVGALLFKACSLIPRPA